MRTTPETLPNSADPAKGSERASLIFKTTQVVRFWDAKRRTLVYLSYTDRIIEGSPQNSVSVVPVGLN